MPPSPRIGIYGPHESAGCPRAGWGLWATGRGLADAARRRQAAAPEGRLVAA